jgi:uncharacterized membrane protein YuzA (DUF378 family)
MTKINDGGLVVCVLAVFGIATIIDVIAVVLVEVCGVLCCIRIGREFKRVQGVQRKIKKP